MKYYSLILALAAFGLVISCKKNDAVPTSTTRTYNMGFANSAPNFTSFDTLILSLNLWTRYADAAIISMEVPWDSLYAGESPQKYVLNYLLGLANFYRSKNLKLWVYIDPENGLNRTSDSDGLVALGKSISQQAVQNVYRRFVVVVDSMLRPDHLGLALETNLIRVAASSAIYNGVKLAVNAAVTDVRAIDQNVKLSVSVQAEVAWGKLGGNGNYVGVDQDLTDFPFVQELGISSYPYFSFTKPQNLPTNYYSNLVAGKSLPVFVSEGGWTSQTFNGPGGTINSSNAVQQDYITRQSELLDQAKAIGVFQLTFTDIELATVPSYINPTIAYFAYLGLVNTKLQPKPGLTTWNEIFKRSLK